MQPPDHRLEKAAKQMGSKLGKVGSVRNFVNIVREVNVDEVRASADLAPRLLVLAPNVENAEKIGDLLTGSPRSPYVSTARLDALPTSGHSFDAVVVFDPAAADPLPRVVDRLRAKELQIPVVDVGAGGQHIRDAGQEPFEFRLALGVGRCDILIRNDGP